MRRFVIITLLFFTMIVLGVIWFKLYSVDNIDWLIPLSVAILALPISIYNTWEAHFVPFELRVYDSGRLEWTKDHRDIKEPMIFADLIFSNFGARKGLVKQMALTLRKADESGEFTLFRPLVVMTDRSLKLGKELMPPDLESFTAFEVGALETTVKKIGFVPHVIPSGFAYAKGSYDVIVFLKGTRYKTWKRVAAMRYSIDDADLAQLNQITSQPQQDGRSFVNWRTQSKVSESLEDSLQELKQRLVKESNK